MHPLFPPTTISTRGSILNVYCTGACAEISLLQTYFYFKYYPKDGISIKWLVGDFLYFFD